MTVCLPIYMEYGFFPFALFLSCCVHRARYASCCTRICAFMQSQNRPSKLSPLFPPPKRFSSVYIFLIPRVQSPINSFSFFSTHLARFSLIKIKIKPIKSDFSSFFFIYILFYFYRVRENGQTTVELLLLLFFFWIRRSGSDTKADVHCSKSVKNANEKK